MQNYTLHIESIYADSLMLLGENKLASKSYYQLCKNYNKWKVKQQVKYTAPSNPPLSNEFGVDEYIRTKANYAGCLMNLGQLQHAIDKFENAKKSVENEIVYENPMLFVNVCNQLGNCYLTKARSAKRKEDQVKWMKTALDNFESSLCLINRMVHSDLPDGVVSRICLNIAMIQSELENHS